MTAMNHEQEGLDAYLRREYAYLGSDSTLDKVILSRDKPGDLNAP